MTTSGPITGFPAPGLHNTNRFITGYNEAGNTTFLRADHGDHHSVMVEGDAVQNIIYSTRGSKVDLNANADLDFATENKPSLLVEGGTVVRLIDFAPGTESNLHRSLSLVYGICCEGELEISTDSEERRIMRPGDVSVNRAGMHKWRNCSKTSPARMVYVLLDVKPTVVNGKVLEEDLGYLGKEYD